jgi:enoyl-CoA hydratase/carnithine racemase
MSGTVHLQQIGEHILWAELDNPPRNTLQARMVAGLREAVDRAHIDTAIRVLVVTGRGPAFCAGADLREELGAAESGERLEGAGLIGELIERMEACRVPVVGLINGWCVGGGLELALCCDIRIASTEARFTAAGVNVGLIASAYRLPRLIGIAAAKAMLLTGSPFDAEAALRFGLVTAVHAPDALSAAGLALAERIASRAPLSVEAAKRMADRAPEMTREEGARAATAEARALQTTDDHKAAVRAFIAKAQPVFTRS